LVGRLCTFGDGFCDAGVVRCVDETEEGLIGCLVLFDDETVVFGFGLFILDLDCRDNLLFDVAEEEEEDEVGFFRLVLVGGGFFDVLDADDDGVDDLLARNDSAI
jgi:hypothetical protein